jgi:hypothetical protein
MSDYRTAEKEFRPLGLDSRTINALAARGINSLRDLAFLTERDISVIPGIGPKAFSQLKIYVQMKAPVLEIHDRPKVVSTIFDARSLIAIDSWAHENKSSSRADAIRRLVELGLKAKR